MRRYIIVTIALMALALGSATAIAADKLVLDNFEDSWTNFNSYVDESGSTLVIDKAAGHEGQGLQFAFDIKKDGWGGAWCNLSGRDLSAYAGGKLSVWVKGDNSGSRFWFTIADAELDIFTYETKVDWEGWKQLSIPLSDLQFLKAKSEGTDKKLTLKNMDSLAIDILDNSKGTLVFDDLALTAAQ